MSKDLRHFVRVWLTVSVLFVAIAFVFDALIDPYLVLDTPRIPYINARKPSVASEEKLMKAYDVTRERPNTLLLGSSSVDLGLDARSSAWPTTDRPVYNLGLGDGSPYVAYRFLQHVMSNHPPSLVVMGLELEYFLAASGNRRLESETELRLNIASDGTPNRNRPWRRVHDIAEATLSLDALTDSADTLIANILGRPSDLVAGNLVSTEPLRFVNSLPLVATTDLADSKRYRSRPIDPLVMQDLLGIISLCEEHGTKLILFISPSRADELEILDLAGLWREFEDWKRNLVQLTATYGRAAAGQEIPLWDFSGYDMYSAEPLPDEGVFLRWFEDSWHYRYVLGDLIIRRVLGVDRGSWGVQLTPQNIEAHLEDIRQQQRLYRSHQPEDARRVRDFYESMAAVRKRALEDVTRNGSL